MQKVLVFGTFDIFHEGHRSFLKQAKKYGDFLRVVVARDETVTEVKKIAPQNGEQSRLGEIQKSALADEVVLGSLDDKYAVVREYKPNVICLGYDQEFFVDKLERKLKEFGLEKTKIVRLESYQPEKYKSSLLREIK
jgi:cytidyltransferase-like protein